MCIRYFPLTPSVPIPALAITTAPSRSAPLYISFVQRGANLRRLHQTYRPVHRGNNARGLPLAREQQTPLGWRAVTRARAHYRSACNHLCARARVFSVFRPHRRDAHHPIRSEDSMPGTLSLSMLFHPSPSFSILLHPSPSSFILVHPCLAPDPSRPVSVSDLFSSPILHL